MTETKPETPESAKLRQRALARWDTEGGAGPDGPQKNDLGGDLTSDTLGQNEMDLQHLQVRVIALESLVIALLAGVSDAQRDLARNMAVYIAPQPGSTPHPLTTRASHQVLNSIERAEQLGEKPRP